MSQPSRQARPAKALVDHPSSKSCAVWRTAIAQRRQQRACCQRIQGRRRSSAGHRGEVWRELFDAARKFSVESHPDKAFPDLGTDAPCPLCQQPLAEGATRLLRFEAFIQQEAEKTSQTRRAALYAEYKPFIAQNLTLNLDDVTYGEIEALDPKLAADVKAFEPLLAARQEAIKAAVLSHQWEGVAQALENPAPRLQALADKLNTAAETLKRPQTRRPALPSRSSSWS